MSSEEPNHGGVAMISVKIVKNCKTRLLEVKMNLINRVQGARATLEDRERGGDEADQTAQLLQESETISNQDRLRKQLMEVESALGRIDAGNFGVCEETEEPIEVERLLAIPWTRLSIEGAEIREAMGRRFAKG